MPLLVIVLLACSDPARALLRLRLVLLLRLRLWLVLQLLLKLDLHVPQDLKNEKVSDEDVAHVFKIADKNSNGMIELKEAQIATAVGGFSCPPRYDCSRRSRPGQFSCICCL